MIQVHPFSYAMFDEQNLLSADLYVVPRSEAAEYLDALADELPSGIAEKLNGGINLLPDERRTGRDGLTTLGMYFVDAQMGRYIELYYGSFVKLFGNASKEKFQKELKRTMYHELTHHVESLAGDRSLELEDERFMADYEAMKNNEPLDVDSVLFAGRDVDLITAAAALFDLRCRENGETIPCACGYTGGEEIPEISPRMKKAAESIGLDLSGVQVSRVSEKLIYSYDAVFCMTEEEADDLADDTPRWDMRIFALGDEDIERPKTPFGWSGCLNSVDAAVTQLADELFAEE